LLGRFPDPAPHRVDRPGLGRPGLGHVLDDCAVHGVLPRPTGRKKSPPGPNSTSKPSPAQMPATYLPARLSSSSISGSTWPPLPWIEELKSEGRSMTMLTPSRL